MQPMSFLNSARVVFFLCLVACGSTQIHRGDTNTGDAGEGEQCGSDNDCEHGLICCYPCGIEGCGSNVCTEPWEHADACPPLA